MITKEPLRILVDAHVFDSGFQGTRTFIKELYQRLAKKQELLIYLAAADIQNLKKEFPGLRDFQFVRLKSNGSARRLAIEFPLLQKKLKINIAHYQYVAPPFKNTKYLITTHDVLFNDYPEEFSKFYRASKNFLFGFSAKQADLLTTVSEYSKKAIAKHLSVKEQQITVIPNGVDTRFFEPYNKENSQQYIFEKFGINKYLLYVSRFEPRKNHILLLDAFTDLKLYEQGYHLVLLGHKSLAVTAFSERLNKLPEQVKQKIFISSEVDNIDLMEFYRAASVFVYPSKAEGFGIPPLEAAALKIPVLCSNTSAMKDFTFFGENHFDPADHLAFRTRLSDLISQGMPESQLEKIASEIAIKYSWDHSAETLFRLFMPFLK